MSAFVTLHEKGVPFELVTLDLRARENTVASFAAASLTCRVPTLVDGNFSRSESSAISVYLEEGFPPPQYAAVYPRVRHARARSRQIPAWLRSDLMPIRQERSTEVVFARPIGKPLSPEAQAAAARLFNLADALLERAQPICSAPGASLTRILR